MLSMTENWHQNVRNKNREEIIAAAKTLFMEQSFLNINIKDVCTTAGVSRVTFYRHFQSMDELIYEVQIEILSSMTQFIKNAPSEESSGRQMLASMLEAWISYASQHPEHIKFIVLFDLHYEAYDSNKELQEQYKNFINSEIEKHFLLNALEIGMRDGSLKPNAEPLNNARFIFVSMMSFLQRMCLTPKIDRSIHPQDIQIANRFAAMLVEYFS